MGVLKGVKCYSSPMAVGKTEDFIATDNANSWTTDQPYSWYAVDLGNDVRVRPVEYRIGLGCLEADNMSARNYLVQASNDPDCIMVTFHSH